MSGFDFSNAMVVVTGAGAGIGQGIAQAFHAAGGRVALGEHGVSFAKAQFAFADPDRVLAEDLSHSSSEKRYYCFGWVDGGVMTVRFTYRDDVIRIFGAGYWRKGKETYEREHQVHGRASRKAEGRS